MTGIVVVSHSRALARAAVALAAEMVHGDDVRIAVAAGLDETTFGTDAVAIVDAVTEVDDGSGVVVLMDLGSAVLSAELALDLLDPEVRERVLLSPAPLVEGLVVAVVAAAGGAGPAAVAGEAAAGAGREAGAARRGPRSGRDSEIDGSGPGEVVTGEFVTGEFEVANPHGLHARPAAALVRQVRPGDAAVELRNVTTGSAWVSAASLSRVATLGALRGHRVAVRASGPGAEQAVDELLALAARRFDEPADPGPAPAAVAPPTGSRPEPGDGAAVGGPFPAAPGLAIGPAVVRGTNRIDLDSEVPGDPAEAHRRCRDRPGGRPRRHRTHPRPDPPRGRRAGGRDLRGTPAAARRPRPAAPPPTSGSRPAPARPGPGWRPPSRWPPSSRRCPTRTSRPAPPTCARWPTRSPGSCSDPGRQRNGASPESWSPTT